MNRTSAGFFSGEETPRKTVAKGISRQLLGYDDSILMVKAEFEAGAVGEIHSHLHSQVTYVESGEFDIYIDGVERRLGPGDSFYVQPNLEHGAVCRKAGTLLDVFSPVRQDFLDEDGK